MYSAPDDIERLAGMARLTGVPIRVEPVSLEHLGQFCNVSAITLQDLVLCVTSRSFLEPGADVDQRRRQPLLRPVRHVREDIRRPAVRPANYNVRVARSALEIDCGDGYTTEADWYVPMSQEPPQGLIYLQHGFLTQPGFYKVTAAKLAESTNSIVVVPSITSNFFACDACHLTGDPMHFAVAKLFSGDRAALNASLEAAFEGEDITLPQKYVLVGHSGGSSIAAGVAGFASQLAGPSGDPDMAGVILFDTNDIGEFVSRGISNVPLATPVYYVGAEPRIINNFDEVSGVIEELRPNQFTGVHIDGGVHADILEGLNPLGSSS